MNLQTDEIHYGKCIRILWLFWTCYIYTYVYWKRILKFLKCKIAWLFKSTQSKIFGHLKVFFSFQNSLRNLLYYSLYFTNWQILEHFALIRWTKDLYFQVKTNNKFINMDSVILGNYEWLVKHLKKLLTLSEYFLNYVVVIITKGQ